MPLTALATAERRRQAVELVLAHRLLTEQRTLRLGVEDRGFRERRDELGVLVDRAGLRVQTGRSERR
jgi:hypothetical protein